MSILHSKPVPTSVRDCSVNPEKNALCKICASRTAIMIKLMRNFPNNAYMSQNQRNWKQCYFGARYICKFANLLRKPTISLFSLVKTRFQLSCSARMILVFLFFLKLFKYFLRSFFSMEFVRFNPLCNRSINCPLYMIEASSN